MQVDLMRNLRLLDVYRMRGPEIIELWGWSGDDTFGAFLLRSPIDGGTLKVVASSDQGWDHVSVSRQNRCPNWPEMEYVRQLFFKDDETCMQLHVPKSEHVNTHPYCLHMWRPLDCEIPKPPSLMVGVGSEPVSSLEEAKARLKEHGL